MSNDPTYIRAFKAWSKRDFNTADLDALEAEMYGESDRSTAITLVAYLERLFEKFVRGLLRRDLKSTEREELFNFRGALGSFSAQISVAYALGAIGELTRDDIQLLRLIRNGAAHAPRLFSFSNQETIDVCNRLKLPDTDFKSISVNYIEKLTDRPVEIGTHFTDNSAKTRFVYSVHTIAMAILIPKEPKRVVMVMPYHLP